MKYSEFKRREKVRAKEAEKAAKAAAKAAAAPAKEAKPKSAEEGEDELNPNVSFCDDILYKNDHKIDIFIFQFSNTLSCVPRPSTSFVKTLALILIPTSLMLN